MGTVYLARAVGAGGFTTEVALKLTHAHLRENPEFSNDLVEEAKISARIRHRNVVSVIDVGEDERGIFLVMEYVEGDSLSGLAKRHQSIPAHIAMRFLLDALDGLHAAHELRDDDGSPLGLVHRDFTPHNILVGTDGVARLADFGIAKAATRLGNTRMGMVKGKIAYMPPEQAKGMPLDRRCDVWAAGVVAWELLAQRRLHGDDDEIAILLRVATEAPPRLTSVADVPGAVSEVVESALTMDLAKRCPSAAAFSKALRGAFANNGGIAEVDEAAAWVQAHVPARPSERPLAAAGLRPRSTSARSFSSVPSIASLPILPSLSSISSITARSRQVPAATLSLPSEEHRAKLPTLVLPTRARPLPLPEPDGKPTDAVSVVGPASPSISAPSASSVRAIRRFGFLGVAAVLVLGATVWRFSKDEPPAQATVLAPPAAMTPIPTVTISAPPPARPPLRVHANAAMAALKVDGRSIPLIPGTADIDVDLSATPAGTAVTIEAASLDGRRVSLMIAAETKALAIEFPAPSPAPYRPPPPSPRPAPRPAPPSLAPSPYP
jgi:serine/threonine-protein kinase